MAGSISDNSKQVSELKYCISLLKPWMKFGHLVENQPFRYYIIEVFHDLTAAILNLPRREHLSLHIKEMEEDLLEIRDSISMEVCNKSYNLPSLLLSHQMHGHSRVRGHTVLLNEISRGRNSNPKYNCNGQNKSGNML